MPSGIYPRTEKHRKITSEATKRALANPEIRKKISEAQKKRFTRIEEREKISKINNGKHLSEEHKRKISKANKGKSKPDEMKKILSEINRGDRNPAKRLDVRQKISESLLGKHQSEETRQKRALSLKGNRCYKWKGGITPINKIIRNSLEMKLWRKAVFIRDNFTCQKCGVSGGKLNAHHINNFSDFPELRFDINNGITLCKHCHKEFHHKYGKKNNTKEQLEEFRGHKFGL